MRRDLKPRPAVDQLVRVAEQELGKNRKRFWALMGIEDMQEYFKLLELGKYGAAKRYIRNARLVHLAELSAKQTETGKWLKANWDEIKKDIYSRIHPEKGQELLERAEWLSRDKYSKGARFAFKRYFKGSRTPETPATIATLFNHVHDTLAEMIRREEKKERIAQIKARRRTAPFPKYRLRKYPARRQSIR